MKKTLIYIFLALLMAVLSGCVQELSDLHGRGGDLEYPVEGKALVEMSVEVPNQGMATKAMGELPDITSFRVVVFGSSGFLKESVDVDPGDFVAASTNGNSTLYKLHVHLSVTDSKNLRINVIANCDRTLPWKNEDVVLNQSAYTTGNQDAYWCRFTLPNGITLKKEYSEATQSMEYVKVGEYYSVTDDVTAAFTGLPMLRNFAKVSVESTTPQLVLNPTTTMAVINRPDRGSVAPYNAPDAVFVDNYKDYTYDDLRSIYDGFAPESMQLIDSDPSTVTFVPCGKTNGTVTGGQFIFERPKPGTGEAPSYLIIHGTYYPLKSGINKTDLPANWKTVEAETPGTYIDLTSGTDCYYKIDFSDDDGYYAILRNFRYHIRVTNVSKVGADTPAEAGSTGGSSDISSSAEAVGLTDISDGYGRIAVSHVEMTIVQAHPVLELKYKFIPDVGEGDNSVDNRLVSEGGPVSITIGSKTGPINVISSTLDSGVGAGTDIDGGPNGMIRVLSSQQDAEGFRTIQFTSNAPSPDGRAEQTIRISGAIDEYKSIYRDVKYILMQRQNMAVECVADVPNPDYEPDYVEDLSGKGVNVNITIPILLPESVFPLMFNIESDKLSLTPNTAKYPDENLPVTSGYSICTGKESIKTFHFVKTLSYAEYNALPENQDTGGKTFTCHFKTNTEASASTVYVTNTYFNLGSGSFRNYSMYTFSGLQFNNYSAAASSNVRFTFNLDSRDATRPRVVQVTLEGLVPGDNSGLNAINAEEGIYSYSLNNNTATIPLRTISTAAGYNGEYGVQLAAFEDGKVIYHEAEHYSTDYISTFTNLGFYSKNGNNYQTTNSLALGTNNTVYFRFDYEDGHTGPSYPVTFTLTGLTTDDNRLVDNGNGSFTFTPTDNNRTQYVQLKSTTRFNAVTVKISSDRYYPVDARTLNRETSFIIPANTIYIRNANTGNPTGLTTGNNGTYVNLNNSNATGYIARSRYSNSYLNNSAMTVALNNFSIVNDDAVVYFNYTANNTTYYATSTLSELLEATTSNRVTLHFRGRIQNTYTVTLSYANYTQASFSNDYVQLTFTNTEYGTNGGNYYKIMGSGQTNGSMTVSQVGSHDEFSITQISLTYRGNGYRNGAVTPTSGSYARNTNTGTWTGGAESVTLTMGKDGNNFNWVRVVTITYSYLE